MTTRRRAKPSPPKWNRRRQVAGLGQAPAAAGRAPPPLDALRGPPDALVAASSRANDTPAASIRALGSSAGSTAEPGTSVHTPCGGKPATPAADPWRTRPLRRYAATVPRERQLPGAARGGSALSSSGTFPFALRPSGHLLGTILLPRSPWTKERRTARRSNSILAADRSGCQPARRKLGRRRTRQALDLKETREGNHPAEGEALPRHGKEIPGRTTPQGDAPLTAISRPKLTAFSSPPPGRGKKPFPQIPVRGRFRPFQPGRGMRVGANRPAGQRFALVGH